MTEERARYDDGRIADLTEAAVDIDSLSGRELDSAIARTLFGHCVVFNVPSTVWTESDAPGQPFHPLPHYSTTYDGMGLVIEAMEDRGYTWVGASGGGYQSQAVFRLGARLVKAYGNSAPTAICRAALKALERAG